MRKSFTKIMAPRRDTGQKQRLDIELAGVATIAFAIFLGIAMMRPASHAGWISFLVRAPLDALFGGLAFWVPVVVGLTGAVCFLEVAEPAVTLTLGVAFFAYLLLLATGFGAGFVGSALNRVLTAIVGDLLQPVLWLLTGMLTVAVTGISIKKLMGRVFYMMRGIRLRSLQLDLPHYSVKDSVKKLLDKPAKKPRQDIQPSTTTTTTLIEPSDLPSIFRKPPRPEQASSVYESYAPPRREAAPALSGHVVQPVPSTPEPTPASTPRSATTATSPSARISSVREEFVWEVEDAIVEEQVTTSGAPLKRWNYRLPPLTIFDEPVTQVVDDGSRAELLKSTLASFGVAVEVVRMERGPSITRYELKPDKGVKISRITALADDLTLALAAVSVRIEAPIPGKSAVGIEVPNAVVSVVALREILQALPSRGTIPPLPMALGKDITGQPVFADLSRMPHLLVAGATGAGKSVCLNNIIASLLTCATPDQVQLLMIDPKRVELTVYNGIPHLVKEVITDARLAAGALFEMTKEMDSRYERFAKAGVRKIEEYNAKFPEEQLPYVVIIIDELADLMLVAPAKVETTICRIAQLARATGIHLIVATQRPSVDVITGIIKANIPSRIAFAVSSQVDSRTILDMAGAERLLGRGDMLFLPIDAAKPKRAQGALVTGEEITRLVNFWAAQARPKNLLEVDVVPIDDEEEAGRGLDPLSFDAARFIIETNYASTAQLQSQFQIGHPRAVRLMKGLEEMRVVGQHEGTKPRKILVGIADLELMEPRFGRHAESPPRRPERYLDGTMPDELGG